MRLLLLVPALLLGCSPQSDPVRIGTKGFVEQEILAAAAVLVLRDEGLLVEPPVQCGDTYDCHEALEEGAIDLLVEYTGTGLVFRGAGVPPGEEALERVRELYAPLGLRWLAPLGFDNGYRLAVRPAAAGGADLHKLSQLAEAFPSLTIACPAEYLRRPVDGLQPLLRRYGMRLSGAPVTIDSPQERLQALLSGQVMASMFYGTDAALLDPRISVVDDDAGFFPPYEAAFLASNRALDRHPSLVRGLRRLEGRFPAGAMQRLNRAVQVQGRPPREVALEYLSAMDILGKPETTGKHATPLVAVSHRADSLSGFELRVAAALRTAFPGRPLTMVVADDPAEEVTLGRARIAVLGAERFFVGQATAGNVTTRETRLDAAAVLGYRAVHLLCRGDTDPARGKIGVQLPASGGGLTAGSILAGVGLKPSAAGTTTALLGKLSSGEIDCAIVLAEPGNEAISQVLSGKALRLLPLPTLWLENAPLRAAYLRNARIPAGTYPGQAAPVETLSSQVLLAGPTGRTGPVESGGPTGTISGAARPLTPATVQALAAAAGIHEAPDPVLPSAWTGGALQDRSPPFRFLETVLNLGVLVFFGWLAYLVFRKEA